MNRTVKRALLWGGAAVALFLVAIAVIVGPTLYRVTVGLKRFETDPPTLPASLNETAILIFSKTNGFRHEGAIPAANAALSVIALQRGWSVFTTENGAVFNPDQLGRFKAVVWNNVTGDVLTTDQREAFQRYIQTGGGFVGIHGAGGDPKPYWAWYWDTLIGAQFVGHPMNPQFQEAVIKVEDHDHPATRHLGVTWIRADEWYSFAASPRAKGVRVLASLDESTYQPILKMPLMKTKDLRMGPDHPIIWAHCVDNGRAFYSALGHQASAYAEPGHLRLLEGALAWAAGLEGAGCVDGVETGGAN